MIYTKAYITIKIMDQELKVKKKARTKTSF